MTTPCTTRLAREKGWRSIRDGGSPPHGLRNCVACADSSPFTRPRLRPKAKIPNHEGTRLRFALDSPLEENGFEPSVPRSMESTSGAKSGLQEGQPAPKHMSGGI